jgi:hypothetical protein
MTQSPLAIIVLFSFGEWESGSALGASDIQIRHSCLPEKSLAVLDSVLGDESLPHARFAVQGEEQNRNVLMNVSSLKGCKTIAGGRSEAKTTG